MKWLSVFVIVCLSLTGLACVSSGGNKVNGHQEAGSSPVNQKEETMYKQAIIRCHKTGGTRIVKINSLLRCF